MRIIVFLLLQFFFALLSKGQTGMSLHIIPIDQKDIKLEKLITTEQQLTDSTAARRALEETLMTLRNNAYLGASIDSIAYQDSSQTAYLFVGDAYEWGILKPGNVEPFFLGQTTYKEKFFQDEAFHYKEIANIQQQLLNVAENNGYPFASVQLDSFRVYGDQVYAQLKLDKNNLILLDDINIEGDAKINPKFLSSYLHLNKEAPYDEEKIRRISSRIKGTGYLTEKKPPYIIFENDKASINLFLENKKSSRFDLLLGFLPKNNETGKLMLTGSAKIDLQNPFGTGKEIYFSWEQLRPLTQRLDVHFLYPYLLNQPFGIDVDFDLYKRDTSYLDLNYNFGIQYHFEGRNYLEAFWEVAQTNVLFYNVDQIKASRELPGNLDTRHSLFGLEYHFEKLDYRFNPRKGYDIHLRGGAGVKRIEKNNKITSITDEDDPTFDYNQLYDSLDLRSYQFKIHTDLAYFQPITKRTTLKTSLRTGILIAEEDLFFNELYRIGGHQLLRGFDEESVFASLYSVLTTEFRFLIAQNSFLYGFGDFGYLQNKSSTNDYEDWPLGFGVGMTFETGAGIFGISYALGRQLGNPIDFGAGKIHFGYINRF